MHEYLGSFTQNSSQKFHKNFINFEKPQKNFKIPKPRSKCVKCMKNKGKRDPTKWFETREGRKSRGLEVLKEKGVFRRWRDWFYWERSGRSKEKNAQILYIEKP